MFEYHYFIRVGLMLSSKEILNSDDQHFHRYKKKERKKRYEHQALSSNHGTQKTQHMALWHWKFRFWFGTDTKTVNGIPIPT